MRGVPKNQWWPVLIMGPVREDLDLNAVFAFPDGAGWAVGDEGTIFFRSPGGVWSSFTSTGDAPLRCAWGPAPEGMLIGGSKVGGKNLLRWHPSDSSMPGHWQPGTVRGLQDITVLFGRLLEMGPDQEALVAEVYCGDSNGDLVQMDLRAPDGTWRTCGSRFNLDLPTHDLICGGAVTPDMAVVVFSEETFWRRRLTPYQTDIPCAPFDSWSPWQKVELSVPVSTSPGSRALRFNAAWADSSGQVWLAGDHGAVARWTPTAGWTVAASLGYRDLFAVHGTGPDDVWVAGDGGAIYRWNGTSWKLSGSKVSSPLFGICATPAVVLAVGEAQTILEFRRA